MELVSIEDCIVPQDVVADGISYDTDLSVKVDGVSVIVSVVRGGGEERREKIEEGVHNGIPGVAIVGGQL